MELTYIIASESQLAGLPTRVTEEMKQGFSPLGAPFKEGDAWHQAMVKEPQPNAMSARRQESEIQLPGVIKLRKINGKYVYKEVNTIHGFRTQVMTTDGEFIALTDEIKAIIAENEEAN